MKILLLKYILSLTLFLKGQVIVFIDVYWEKVNEKSTKRFVDFFIFSIGEKFKMKRDFWVRHRRCHTEIPKNSLHIFCFGNQVILQGFLFREKNM